MNYVQKIKSQLQEQEIIITRTIDGLEFLIQNINDEISKTTSAKTLLFLQECRQILRNEITLLQSALANKPLDL